MEEARKFIANYLDGKTIAKPIKRILTLLFCTSISSFIYEKIYGQYQWFDIDNYKAICTFFVKGSFFIPLSIFLIVWTTTKLISSALLAALTHLKSVTIQRKIIAFQIKRDDISEGIRALTKVSKVVLPMRINAQMIESFYNSIKDSLTPEYYQSINEEMKSLRKEIESNFQLFVRMLIAITVYKFSLPQFGWFLYALVLIITLSGMILLVWGYLLSDTLPLLVRKFHVEAEKFFTKADHI